MNVRSKTWLRGVRRALWIATTPLALTVLLAQPARAQHDDHGNPPAEEIAAEAHGHDAHAEGEHGGGHHAPSANPIQNWVDFKYADKDTHDGKYEPEKGDHKKPPPFSAALLNFGVLLFLLGKFAAPAIKKMAHDRHEEVAKALEESTRLRDAAKAKLDEYSKKVADLDAEIAKLVEGIRAEAEHDKRRILGEAEQRAQRMAKEAEQTIAAEVGRVRLQLEREVTLTAIAVAEKLLIEKTTDADQRALNEQFIRALGAAKTPPRA